MASQFVSVVLNNKHCDCLPVTTVTRIHYEYSYCDSSAKYLQILNHDVTFFLIKQFYNIYFFTSFEFIPLISVVV